MGKPGSPSKSEGSHSPNVGKNDAENEGEDGKKVKIKPPEEGAQDMEPKPSEEEGAKGEGEQHPPSPRQSPPNPQKPLLTTYRMRPQLKELFPVDVAKQIIQEIMHEKLGGKTYKPEDAGKWSREIADGVNAAVNERLEIPRYKYVVQVTLGQQMGAGCRYVANCCWDAEADSYASDVFTNATIFCVCTVFGVYLY